MTRFGWVMATYFSAMATVGLAFVEPVPRLIWNASASTPIGLYVVRPTGALRDTELVAVMPTEPVASFLADGGYLPRGVPLMKRVLALPGQIVCRHGLRITIDRVEVGDAQARDRRRWGRFSDEPRRPRQSGRPVFRPTPRQFDRRAGGSSLDR